MTINGMVTVGRITINPESLLTQLRNKLLCLIIKQYSKTIDGVMYVHYMGDCRAVQPV